MIRWLFISGLLACSSDKSITTVNATPEAVITSHFDGDEVREGYAIVLRGSASDSNNTYDELTTTWYSGTEVICEAAVPQSDGTTECEVVISMDDATFTLEVKDPENATGSTSVTVVVAPTESPQALISTPTEDGVYYSDQLITFSGILSDGEDAADTLMGYWESNVDGILEDVVVSPNTDGDVEGFVRLSEGEHAIQLHVEDSTGKTASDSVIIAVGPPNSAPLCAITEPASGAAGAQGELVTFVGNVSDVDVSASMLSVEWSSDKDGVLGSSAPDSSGMVNFPFSALTVNTHVISMTVADEVGAECVANTTFSVGTPPTVTIDLPMDSDVYGEGDTVTFSATVFDAQDQPNLLDVDWTVNGNPLSTQGATSTGTAQFTDSTLAPDTYTLIVTVTDTDGLTADDITTFSVNGLPSAPTVSIAPDPAFTTDDLIASATGSVDPEGNTVSYDYEWYRNGTSSGNTGATLAASFTSKGETWTVFATPNDGVGGYGPSSSAFLTIANTPPTLGLVSISPTAGVYNNGTVSCSVTVTDPDETVVPSYEWSIGGVVVGTNSALSLAAVGAMPADSVTCTATATDSDGASVNDSASLTVGNRNPVVSGVAVTPITLYTNSMATCGFSATDPDGDALTTSVEWVSNGTTVIGSGATFQLDNSLVSPGDVLGCRATASDGSLSDTKTGTTVTIANTPPTLSVSITGTATNNSAELTCVANATDIDEPQGPTLTYLWSNTSQSSTLGASAVLQLNASLAANGDVLSCLVTATDSSGSQVSASNTITITNTAPTAPSVSVSPDPATMGNDDLLCSVDVPSTDDDGDSVVYTYVWTDDAGTIRQMTSEVPDTSNVYLASGTSEGTWTCTVTPFDGTSSGAPDSASLFVESGCYSLAFDGSSDRILLSSSSALGAFTSAMTVEAWVKWTDDGSNWHPIVQQGWGTSDSLFFLSLTGPHMACNQAVSPGLPHFEFKSDPPDPDGCLVSDVPVQEDVWTHVAAVYDSGNIKIFVQGELTAEKQLTTSMLQSTTPVSPYIGYSVSASNTYFSGSIFGVQLSDSVRYAQAYSVPLNPQADANTVGLWHLNEGVGTIAEDSSSNALDGTITGAAWMNSCPEGDADGDGVAGWQDCNDNDSSVYPLAGDIYGDGVDSDCDGLDCEADSDGSTYFAVCPDHQSYGDWYNECLDAGYDGLASIQSATENDFVYGLLSSAGLENSEAPWIGYSDGFSEGNWSWVDSSTAGYTNWSLNEPNGGTGENCAHLNWPLGTGGWNDNICNDTIGAVCQIR